MARYAKKVSVVLVALLVIVMSTLVLVSCSKLIDPLTGDSDTAVTTNNNSMAVTHGDYLYFINGNVPYDAITEAKDNKYGNVTKGAIYRIKKNDPEAKPEVVVPQLAMSNNNKNGISVLGGWIYFTSPSTTTNNKGELQTSRTDFYRVGIDGQDLEKITTVYNNSMDYKFTDSGLFYVDVTTKDLKYVDYDKKKEVTIAEGVSNYSMDAITTYTPGDKNLMQNVVYTATPEDTDGKNFNQMWIVDAKGGKKMLMDGSKDNKEQSYSVKKVSTDAGKLVVYYELTDNTVNDSVNGLYVAKFNENNEIESNDKLLNETGSTVYYDGYKSIYVFAGDKMYIPAYNDGVISDKLVEFATHSKITATSILTIRDGYVYYMDGSALCKVQMTVADDKGSLGIAEILVESNIKTGSLTPVLDGNTFYYVNSKYLNYLYRVDIATEGAKHYLVGERTEVDSDDYVEMVKDMDEEERAEHDKLMEDGIYVPPYEEK